MSTARGPDPSEFENAFVIEDESEEPSRVGTPAIRDEKAPAKAPTMADTPPARISGEGAERGGEASADAPPAPAPVELPTDVRKKLQKLDKMESRYAGKLTGWDCEPLR